MASCPLRNKAATLESIEGLKDIIVSEPLRVFGGFIVKGVKAP